MWSSQSLIEYAAAFFAVDFARAERGQADCGVRYVLTSSSVVMPNLFLVLCVFLINLHVLERRNESIAEVPENIFASLLSLYPIRRVNNG